MKQTPRKKYSKKVIITHIKVKDDKNQAICQRSFWIADGKFVEENPTCIACLRLSKKVVISHE
jgi:hypothetical protein